MVRVEELEKDRAMRNEEHVGYERVELGKFKLMLEILRTQRN